MQSGQCHSNEYLRIGIYTTYTHNSLGVCVHACMHACDYVFVTVSKFGNFRSLHDAQFTQLYAST